MNTKQIWQALTSNNITEPFFDGVFPSDRLRYIKKKPELIICNTDPSDKPGKHWLLLFFYGETVDFYDSLGKDLSHYGEEFELLVAKFAKTYNKINYRTQPQNSNLCGYYCLYFAYGRCKGYSMEYIVNSMTSPEKVVKFVLKTFSNVCKDSNCPILQSCTQC